jgi:hypothetical protein
VSHTTYTIKFIISCHCKAAIKTANMLQMLSISIKLLVLILGISSAASLPQEPKIKRVHLVFSNHLDIGFHSNLPETPGTDANVLSHYFKDYFPAAVAVAETMRQRGGPERYRYLTHSFLVSLYLNDCPGEKLGIYCPTTEEKERFKDAIAQGDILWHAYPHNLQTELINDPDLVKYAVQLSHHLDRQFNLPLKRVISQRDVPGLTRAAIPILSQAGVKAISVGVNSGSAPPADITKPNKPFLWKDERSGASIIAFWHPGGYSGNLSTGDPLDGPDGCVSVPGFDEVLCAAWRTDNAGPHSVDEVIDIFARARENFPQAEEIFASTYDDFIFALESYLSSIAAAGGGNTTLPVVTQEIGDTWIYGVGSDPARVAEFRALVRLRQRLLTTWKNNKDEQGAAFIERFSRLLLKIPEHTWGVDTKEYPGDYTRWSNADLRQVLEDKVPEFQVAVRSWQRQRAYTSWAVEELAESSSDEIRRLIDEYYTEMHYLKSMPNNIFLPSSRGDDSSGSGSGGGDSSDRGSCRPVWQSQQENQGDLVFESNSWKVGLDASTGAISELIFLAVGNHLQHPCATSWASPDALLAQIMYSTYNEDDYDAIWSHYAYRTAPLPDWFYKDFGKPKSSSLGGARRRQAFPKLKTVWECFSKSQGFHIVSKMIFEDESLVTDAGAPVAVYLEIISNDSSDDLFIDVILENKTATRLPEAAWLSFQPAVHAVDSTSWTMSKLGREISPLEVMRNGSMSQHAVDEHGISVTSACGKAVLNIRSLDATLVSPGKPTPFPMVEELPDLSRGMHFNLHNNVWGTNYVMWWPYQKEDETIRFRFVVRVEETGEQSVAEE